MAASSSVPLLKGYLPVRLMLPPLWTTEYHDETYFYVREHQAGKGDSSENPSKPKSTLFIANAPLIPGVSTKILLHSLLGRFANIARVTVIKNPRGGKEEDDLVTLKWTDKFQEPSPLPVVHSEGKFAHVVFETPKGMKKALRALQDVMKPNASKKSGKRPGLNLEPIEIQTLSDETNRVYREERNKELNTSSKNDRYDDRDNSIEEGIVTDQATGIHAVVARYKESLAELSPERLMEECNAVMKSYEEAEEEKRRTQQAARTQPDEDGFVTVSYSNAVGSQVDLEVTKHPIGNTQPRRKGSMRSRKKKESVGSQELQDFYRFQRRENKKRTLEDLRAQFDEDLQRVKRMKEERRYRPF